MFFKKKIFHKFLSWSIVSMTIFLLASIKISYIWGSIAAGFSASGMLMPLTGAFGGAAGAFLTTLARFSLGIHSRLGLHILAYHIPGFCASLAWVYPSVSMRIILPVVCIALFWMHPVGYAAAPYALFWLLPILFFFIKRHSLLSTAISATFIAHAVGSVIWLYTLPMQAATWIALIPVVAVERCIQIVLLMMGYCVISAVSSCLQYCFGTVLQRVYRKQTI